MDYVIYFILTIGILVFVHEFGHFAAAKLSKMRVDVFSMGFGKRLLGWNKLTGFSFGDLAKDFDGLGNTDYRLCLLPLGGYVKIAGMVDESFDTKFASEEPKPYEFRAKPTRAKLFVITAGVLMNLLLTLLIFWGINSFQPVAVAKSTIIAAVENGSIAQKVGFQSYDEILSVNNISVNNWREVEENILGNRNSKFAKLEIKRNGNVKTFWITTDLIKEYSQDNFILTPYPSLAKVVTVLKNSPAQKAGINSGDLILSFDSKIIVDNYQLNKIIQLSANKTIPIVILRNNDTIKTFIRPSLAGKIGISHALVFMGKKEYVTYGFLESIPLAVKKVEDFRRMFFKMIQEVFSGNVEFKEAFGGPIKIAKYAVTSADNGIDSFFYFLAILSLNLAIINIMPFPVLDGGHFIIILVEGIIRRELPLKFKMAMQNVGFVFLLLLMAFIIYNDVISA